MTRADLASEQITKDGHLAADTNALWSVVSVEDIPDYAAEGYKKN